MAMLNYQRDHTVQPAVEKYGQKTVAPAMIAVTRFIRAIESTSNTWAVLKGNYREIGPKSHGTFELCLNTYQTCPKNSHESVYRTSPFFSSQALPWNRRRAKVCVGPMVGIWQQCLDAEFPEPMVPKGATKNKLEKPSEARMYQMAVKGTIYIYTIHIYILYIYIYILYIYIFIYIYILQFILLTYVNN